MLTPSVQHVQQGVTELQSIQELSKDLHFYGGVQFILQNVGFAFGYQVNRLVHYVQIPAGQTEQLGLTVVQLSQVFDVVR